MQIPLISPLNLEECVVRLEKSKKQNDIPFSSEYHPPYGEIIGHAFTLSLNIGKYFPFMYGKFMKINEGTLITCSMKISKSEQNLRMLWAVIGLPFFSFLTCFSLLNGIEEGFSISHLIFLALGIGLFILYFYMWKVKEKQSELDKQELLDFLIQTLEAKPKSP